MQILPPALSGELRQINAPRAGRLAYYAAGTGDPILFVHSVNAAASAYEVRPLYEHYRAGRAAYALDLPGFGHSERGDRPYSARMMTDAIHAVVDEIMRIHGPRPIDALALSLGSEFLARAASETASAFRTAAFVSPTGFDGGAPYQGPPGSTRGKPVLRSLFNFPIWTESFFNLLTSRPSIRYFLQKTWGSRAIDEGLFAYDYITTHQAGARHAPYAFVSGYLFSKDITRIYESLSMPAWLVHGVRGDFTNFDYAKVIAKRANWTVRVFPTGALPHFEMPEAFITAYDDFLAAPASRGAAG